MFWRRVNIGATVRSCLQPQGSHPDLLHHFARLKVDQESTKERKTSESLRLAVALLSSVCKARRLKGLLCEPKTVLNLLCEQLQYCGEADALQKGFTPAQTSLMIGCSPFRRFTVMQNFVCPDIGLAEC